MRREQCASCSLPVFLAEKLVVARSAYHRSCFRCARCRHQLTPGNYYETKDGQYCCEACPDLEAGPRLETGASSAVLDEEKEEAGNVEVMAVTADSMLVAPLSDEEKSKQRSQLELVSSHLLDGIIVEQTASRSKDRFDGPSEPPEEAPRLEGPESDEQKSARRKQLLLIDDKFDVIINRINERIGELTVEDDLGIDGQKERSTTTSEQLEEAQGQHQQRQQDEKHEKKNFPQTAVVSPDRRPRGNSAPDLEAEFKQAISEHRRDKKEKELMSRRRTAWSHSSSRELGPRPKIDEKAQVEPDDEPGPALRRWSSLRIAGEYTKDQPRPEQPRRHSLVQRRLRLFKQKPEQRSEQSFSPDKQEQQLQPMDDYPEELNPFASDAKNELSQLSVNQRIKKPPSSNPFGSSDEDESPQSPAPATMTPKPVARSDRPEESKKRLLEAPKISLNPFWSDGEEPDSGQESEPELRNKSTSSSLASPPIPRPRTLRHSHAEGSLQLRSNLTSSSIHSSNTSIASACSTMTQSGTYRKKKPAPPPPLPTSLGTSSQTVNASNNSPKPSLSPRLTPRTRKAKPAPLPPLPSVATSTPNKNERTPSLRAQPTREPRLESMSEPWRHVWDEEKLSKDEANRNTQSLSFADDSGYLDKSLDAKWKRKKGPAPPRPVPLRRKIRVMSMKDVKLELDQIEVQQQGLEKQGVRLEQIIREKCESDNASEDTSLGLDVEELVLELFALVNEKNELFRRQAELMLLRRQQRLEEEHADIEYQVRCLISQPEATKTDFDKQREEALIQKLVEIVERRNEIIECLEMDRRREIEEDRSINREMDLYAAHNKADNINITDESRRATKQKKGKAKEKKSKKSGKKDADKDVDETESKHKRHSFRKWF